MRTANPLNMESHSTGRPSNPINAPGETQSPVDNPSSFGYQLATIAAALFLIVTVAVVW
jgi:hypothetical protein